MADKQVAPPFGVKQVSESKDETLATLGDEPTAEVSGLSDAVDEAIERENEKQVELDAGGANYWASGGTNIGGLELGNRAPSVAPLRGSKGNPFLEPKANERNPFARKAEAPQAPSQTVWPDDSPGMLSRPSWRELVNFVLEHGKDIQRVRYPNPPVGVGAHGASTVIDTVWKGVPVWNAGKCEIEHVKYGWTDWADCVS
jgi:hypothetical protein